MQLEKNEFSGGFYLCDAVRLYQIIFWRLVRIQSIEMNFLAVIMRSSVNENKPVLDAQKVQKYRSGEKLKFLLKII